MLGIFSWICKENGAGSLNVDSYPPPLLLLYYRCRKKTLFSSRRLPPEGLEGEAFATDSTFPAMQNKIAGVKTKKQTS